jgi:hypothetical protein
MARPLKHGLDYFPLDTRMDDKVEFLESKHGLIGFAIYIKLLQEIYQTDCGTIHLEEKSEFSKWNTLGKRYGIPLENLRIIIKDCVTLQLFDKESYEKGILTSNGIKKRMESTGIQRFKDRERKGSFPGGKVHKVKESKVKESKVNKGRFTPPSIQLVQQYCKERKSPIKPQNFFDYFESSGWIKMNGQPVKDWKATLRTWENRIEPVEKKREVLRELR